MSAASLLTSQRDTAPDTLRAVVEEFITRAGTDYGEREWTLDETVADVMRQLRRGEVAMVFDTRAGTVNIVPPMPRRV